MSEEKNIFYPQTLQQLQLLFRERLKGIYDRQETDSIFSLAAEFAIGLSPIQLHTQSEVKLGSEPIGIMKNILERLALNEPIQYVLGRADFYGLNFEVNGLVLIPRQETELLVDSIIRDNKLHQPRILDIGTGSGCIAISLKKHIMGAQVTAIDISPGALETARRNAIRHQMEIDFRLDDILHPHIHFPLFDLIVSNPPYIRMAEQQLMQANVLDFEPHSALFVPDADALLFYKAIASYASNHLKPSGVLWVEINESLADETIDVFRKDGFTQHLLIQDLNQKNRIIKSWR
ncbi:MAG: peptide chain release factor N(5)-glutamine methyltransferase [Bacteroidota bacterium]|nr:MAG: peptide chain release factor N(5)-glutamine methyltransferase [Bacteroidota bacterium]